MDNKRFSDLHLPQGVKLTDPIEIEEEDILSEVAEEESIGQKILQMFRSNKLTLISAIVLLAIILIAVFAPVFAPYDPTQIDSRNGLAQPSSEHPLGTDVYGRDILSRLIYGGRISLIVGFVPTIISTVIGVFLGLVSGYFGGKADFIIMRIADIVLSFPSLLLALLIRYTFNTGLLTMFIALSFVSWAGTARIVRSQTLSLKEKEFVEAATSIGVKKMTIIFRHILPNCLPSIIVMFTLNIPSSIMTESMLSFLGVGITPPDSSWGLLINEYKKYLFQIPIAALAPGIAILLVVLSFNFLGDGLRDAIDPYMKEG